jgi:hypothetical protein
LVEIEVLQKSWHHPLTPPLEIRFGTLPGEQAKAGIDKSRGVRSDNDKDSIRREDAACLRGCRGQIADELETAHADDDVEMAGRERHILGRGATELRLHPALREGACDFILIFVNIQPKKLAGVLRKFRQKYTTAISNLEKSADSPLRKLRLDQSKTLTRDPPEQETAVPLGVVDRTGLDEQSLGEQSQAEPPARK